MVDIMKSRFTLLFIVCLLILIIPSVMAQSFTQCTDSDFGNDPYKQGTLTFTDTNGNVSTFTDECVPLTPTQSPLTQLTEYFCFNGNQASIQVNCPGGCNPQTNTCNQVCYSVGDDGYDPYKAGLTILDINQMGIDYRGIGWIQENRTFSNEIVETYTNGSVIVITSNMENLSPLSRTGALHFFFINLAITAEVYYAPNPIITDITKFEDFFFPPLNGRSMSEYASWGVGFKNFKYDFNISSGVKESYCNSNGGISYKEVLCQTDTILSECISGTPDFSENQCQISVSPKGWGDFDNNNLTILDNCCGSSDQDNGLIVPSKFNAQYICTLNNGGDWRSLEEDPLSFPGTILKINRGEMGLKSQTPKDLFNYSITKDNYDILVNNNGEFITCDIDGSLDSIYSEKRSFNNFSYCIGNSGPRCLTLTSTNIGNPYTSQFVCYPEGNREAIVECAMSSSQSQKFNKISDGDDYDAYTPGEFLKSPFSRTYEEFIGYDKCPNNDQLCLNFDNPGDIVEADIKKEFLWGDYDYLEFNINSMKGFAGNITYELYGGGTGHSFGKLEDHIVTEKNGWFNVRLPVSQSIVPPNIRGGINYPLTASSFKLISSQSLGQVQIESMHFISPDQLVCAKVEGTLEAKWISELDDLRYKSACDSRFAGWTGTKCCGDDFSDLLPLGSHQGKTEYFVDSGGICFNSLSYEQNKLSPITVKNQINQSISSPRLLTNGTSLFGCNLDASYNWTKNILQTDNNGETIPNSKLNIIEYNSCSFVELNGKSYFCSPEGWSDESYSANSKTISPKDRTILSNNLTGTSSQCCSPDTCWNGNECEYVSPPTQGQTSATLCVNGQWRTNAEKQTDWLNLEYDFCPNNDDCLLDSSPSGAGTKVICQSDKWFSKSTKNNNVSKSSGGVSVHEKYSKVAGLYCNSGNWTSRTSFIAERMLTLQTDDYTLVCGPHEEVLVNNDVGKAYNTLLSNSPNFINAFDEKYFNNLCVLSYEQPSGENIIVIGTSFNELGDGDVPNPISLQKALHQSFDIDMFDTSNCESSADVHDFVRCDNVFSSNSQNSYFYWNNLTQSFIYTPNGGDVIPSKTLTKLYNLLISPILNILNIANSPTHLLSPQPLVNTNMYNFIYFSNHGNKKIEMLIEPREDLGTIKEFISVRYEGFNEDICGSVNVIDPYGQKTICEKNGTVTNLFAFTGSDSHPSIKSGMDFIKSASTSTRIK